MAGGSPTTRYRASTEISAAADEGGANVLLIDASDRLGGAVTAAMHRSLCGLYAGPPKSPVDTLNSGTQRNIIELMLRHDSQRVLPRQFGKAWVLEFPTSAWLAALEETCRGIDLKLIRRDLLIQLIKLRLQRSLL